MRRRADLQAKVDRVNKALEPLGVDPYELDYAACYGGYCLTRFNGSSHATHRMPLSQLYLYLDGLELGLFISSTKG